MKTLTFEEAKQMIQEVAFHSAIYIKKKTEYNKEEVTILGNGVVWDKDGAQIGTKDASWISENTMNVITENGTEFRLYSNYFNWATGDYKLVN